MTTYEFVRDYYFPLMGIFPDTDIHKAFCLSVESGGDDLCNSFNDLVNFINLKSDPRVKSFDIINRYFNRMRCMLNDDFNLNLPYTYFH